jgi:hypothetical protein
LRRFVPVFLISIGVLVQVSPASVRAFSFEPDGLTISSLHAGKLPERLVNQADLDGDGVTEQVVIQDSRAKIISKSQMVWSNPEGWHVDQAEVSDLNQDGLPEVALLVWRPFRAWPVDKWLPHGGRIDSFQDTRGYSCQIILIGWSHNQFREVWAGSALAEPVRSFRAADLDGDLLQELVTLEGSYASARSAPAHYLKIWKWNGFGFSNVYTLKGTFAQMALVKDGWGHFLILVP